MCVVRWDRVVLATMGSQLARRLLLVLGICAPWQVLAGWDDSAMNDLPVGPSLRDQTVFFGPNQDQMQVLSFFDGGA